MEGLCKSAADGSRGGEIMAADGTIRISTELDSTKAQGAMAKFSDRKSVV